MAGVQHSWLMPTNAISNSKIKEKTMKKLVLAAIVTAMSMTGCAQMNNAITPSVDVAQDEFTGATVVTQDVVSATDSMTDGWNLLGFIWNSYRPDYVYINAGVTDSPVNIKDTKFKVGNDFIQCKKTDQIFTSFQKTGSIKQCYMPLSDFKRIATADKVMLRIETGDGMSTSSFGAGSSATVSSKFVPFLAAIEESK